jgi:translation initiation factor IF-1
MKDEEKDLLLEEMTNKIKREYIKIIEDWCEAYVAQYYRDTKSMINPGDFVLCEQVPTFDSKTNCMVKRYWFEPKE